MPILISDTLPIFLQVNKFCACTYTSYTCTVLVHRHVRYNLTAFFFFVSPGVRLLRQEPTECLFSFICTSNNHISRIQGMVERLCQALGRPLCQLDQTTYHNFPSLSVLAGVHFFLFGLTLSVFIFK